MKDMGKIITPLTTQGGKKVHRRHIPNEKTACGHEYFTRKTTGYAKSRVIR